MARLSVAQIAGACGCDFEGDGERLLTGANALDQAGPDELSFASKTGSGEAAKSLAGCLIVRPDFKEKGGWALIRAADPRACFTQVLSLLYPRADPVACQHPSAVLAPDVTVGEGVSIGALVAIGAGTRIASGCSIAAGCIVGEGVSIGPDTTLHARVTLYDGVQIGARVVMHSGCVIGADGFGFVRVGDSYRKFPQVGTVLVEDDVEIGANTCIDRGALGRTIVGRGSKLDNLIHVAHNVQIGCHVVIAAQTGISGGVTVGDHAVIGGQVGMGDKARIESKAVVGSGSGILTGQQIRAGEPVWGTPARPLRQHLKGLAHVNKLSAYWEELKAIKQRLQKLENDTSAHLKNTLD